MTGDLPRLKPSPIPSIYPVPEYLADERLRAVYEDTKSVLQVPWMGVVTMAFAHYHAFYAVLWGGMRKVAATADFVAACRTLRDAAEREAETLEAKTLVGELRDHGYSDRELDEIRDQIEIFSHGNMPYLLIATAARLLLEGHELSDKRQAKRFDGRHGPSTLNRLTLIEPHHADAPTRKVYDDIKATMGLPFVNTDYRALARWPSYFAMAWNDLQPHVDTDHYRGSSERVHDVAVDLTRELANPGQLSSQQLRNAASKDGTIDETVEVVRLFQWLLPSLVVNVAYFRQQLA
jgi:hypothetical protein